LWPTLMAVDETRIGVYEHKTPAGEAGRGCGK
jgi:hypothetical protein